MRHKRAKVYKRAIAVYTSAFGFRTPFQILVSNDVILATNRESDLWKQLAACVQGEIKPMITQCCVQALYALGKEHQHETEIAKSFERRKCNHRTAIDPNECLKDVIGPTNKHRYVLATQAKVLRLTLSAIPGLPIIHFNPRGVLVLSPPSHATLKHKDAIEAERLLATDPVVDVVDGSNVIGAEPTSGIGPGKSLAGRNRVKGPNPLSVKKKKAPAEKGKGKRARDEGEEIDGQVEEPVVAAEAVADGKKRKRRRKKGIVAEAIEEIERDFEAKAAAGGDGDSD